MQTLASVTEPKVGGVSDGVLVAEAPCGACLLGHPAAARRDHVEPLSHDHPRRAAARYGGDHVGEAAAVVKDVSAGRGEAQLDVEPDRAAAVQQRVGEQLRDHELQVLELVAR